MYQSQDKNLRIKYKFSKIKFFVNKNIVIQKSLNYKAINFYIILKKKQYANKTNYRYFLIILILPLFKMSFVKLPRNFIIKYDNSFN